MAEACPRTLRVARAVRRRFLLAGAVRDGGRGLAAGSAAGLAWVLGGRLWGIGPEWWQALALAAGAGLAIGAAVGAARIGSLFRAAVRADTALGLRDRLATAISLGRMERGLTASEVLAVRAAEEIAPSVRVRNAVPVTFGAAWAVWPLLLAGAVATGVWMPHPTPATVRQARAGASEPERRAAATTIAEVSREARDAAEEALREVAGEDELAALDELERELLDGEREPEEALAAGAKHLSIAADTLERSATQDDLATQEVREQLAQGLSGEGASELAEALSAGDLERARQAASDLLGQAPTMSEEERARYAEELRRLAEQLDTLAADPESGPDAQSDPAMSEQLRERGIDNPESLANETDPEAIREQLTREGLDPLTAERLARDIAQQNTERAAERQAEQELRDLSSAARDAARELSEPPSPPRPEPRPDEQRPPQDEPAPDNEPRGEPRDGQSPDEERRQDPQREGDGKLQADGDGESPKGGERQQQGSESGREGGERQTGEGEQPRQQGQGQREQGQQGEQGREGEAGESQQGEGREGRQGAEREGGQREGAREGADPGQERQGAQGREGADAGQREGGGQPGQEGGREGAESQGREGAQPQTQPGGAGGEGEREAAPGGEPGQRPGQRGGGAGETERMTDGSGDAPTPGARRAPGGEPPQAEGLQGLREQLERMSSPTGDAAEKRQAADELRRQAERLLGQASPEERERLERLAREMRDRTRPAPGERGSAPGIRPGAEQPYQTEAFDARTRPDDGNSGPQQVIAEWFGEGGDDAPAGAASPGAGAAPLRQAAEGAERAIDRQAVPRARSDLVRRVFERFQRRAERSGGDREGAQEGGE